MWNVHNLYELRSWVVLIPEDAIESALCNYASIMHDLLSNIMIKLLKSNYFLLDGIT